MNQVKNMHSNNLLGIFYMLFSCLSYAIINCLVKFLGDDISAYNIAFYRYLFSLITIIPFLFYIEFNWNWKKIVHGMSVYNVLRSVLSFISMVWFTKGLTQTPLNEAMAITFITPIFMSILAIIILKEKAGIEKWIAIFISLLGGLIIINPDAKSFNYSSLYIIGACFLWALTNIIVKILSQKQNPIVISFYMSLLTVAITLPLFAYNPYIPKYKDLLLLFLLGIFYNLALFAATKACSLTQLTVMAPFDFFRIVLSSVLGVYFFNEVIANNTIMGAALIILGGTFALGRELRAKFKK